MWKTSSFSGLFASGAFCRVTSEQFQFETLCVSNHTACRFVEKAQLSCPPIFRLHCRPARFPLPPLAADAACRGREGDPVRPQGGRSAAAGADITRPERPGRFAPTPRTTRGGRGSPTQETNFAFPHKGEYGGAGGVEGEPLSPHAPRRAGDLPPMPGSSRDAQRDSGSTRPGRFTFFKGETL